ncbi:MAG: hypothetical protein HY051_04840 [Candidatus Aenigmarchaeota archaeon]|nr:hypothetical protein [Candidatus Aenigmarchaeota archaeon]
MNEADYSRLCVRYSGIVYKGISQIEENLPHLKDVILGTAQQDRGVLQKGSRIYKSVEHHELEIWYKSTRKPKAARYRRSGEYNKW